MKFSDRLNLARDCEKWMEDNGADHTVFSIITHLDSIGLLNDEIEVIPVDFIGEEIDRTRLEHQIAMSEGDEERAERWIIRQVAFETLIAKWRAERNKQ